MPELQKQSSNGDAAPQKSIVQPTNMPRISSALLPNPHQRKHWAKQYRTEIAASSSSLLSTFAAVSASVGRKAPQPSRCLAPMASVTLVRTISFSIYQKAKYSYSAAIGRVTGEEPLVTVNRPGSIPTPGTMLCFGAAGATAGALVAFIACPFELTKQAAQISVLMASSNKSSVDDPVRSSYQQKGAFGTARNVILHRGVQGLYSGFGFHICIDIVDEQ
ncbi:MAG: hypothetical protein Q9200_000891 [Gallowayella weberi]